MRQFIISEERLKQFIKHERELAYAHDSIFYCPSEEELEPTEDDLKSFAEIKEDIKENDVNNLSS